jgi:hypothetical protein
MKNQDCLHPLKVEINSLQAKINELEKQLYTEQRIHRATLKPEYEYEVHTNVQKQESWMRRVPAGTEYIIIIRKLTNEHIFNEHMNLFGSITNKPNKEEKSVKYYVKHGVLLHDGGGYIILEDEQPCSPEEWEQLKLGNFGKFNK